MPAHTAPSTRTVLLTLAAVVAVLATTLAACEPSGIQPPDGWEQAGEGQWVRVGADLPADAFRDLSSVEAMGVADTTDEVVRYAKEQMLYLYRTSPEIVDSLFDVAARPLLERDFPSEGFQDEVDAALEEAKKAIVGDGSAQPLYRQSVSTGTAAQPAVYPDSLKAAGVAGQVVVQALVNEEGDPIAVQLVESVNPTLDALVMRQAATTDYTQAWVVEGNRGGRGIQNYARTSITFE